MKTQFKFFTIASGILCVLAMTSCEKNANDMPQNLTESTEKAAVNQPSDLSITSPYSPYKILGLYSLRGSRTKYRGQANQNGDNIIVIYDYFGEKTIETSRSDKGFTCGYGEPNLTSLGWKYIIRYNPISKQILLSPNDTMAAAIKPDSFEALAAVYDPALHSFTFQTRYTDTDGNENEVLDILNKE